MPAPPPPPITDGSKKPMLNRIKEAYIHANQNFHVAKQYQKIIGSREPSTCRRLPRKKGPAKFFFGDIDFNTSIHFISDIISSKSGGVFYSARQVKSNYWALAP